MPPAAIGRPNQRSRTRKDLLEAASRLARRGVKPSIEEIAAEALVSRATAYRYFPSADALMLEAALDVAVPAAEDLFRGEETSDPVKRVEKVDSALHDMILANEPAIRMMLVQSLERAIAGTGNGNGEFPGRQNRRTPLIEAALAPARRQLRPAVFETLVRALALVIGTEGVVACRDVLQLDDAESRKVKRWAIRSLIDAARKPQPLAAGKSGNQRQNSGR